MSVGLFFAHAHELPSFDLPFAWVVLSHMILESLILLASYLVLIYLVLQCCAQKYGVSPSNILFPLVYGFVSVPLFIGLILVPSLDSTQL